MAKKKNTVSAADAATMRYQAIQAATNAGRQVAPTNPNTSTVSTQLAMEMATKRAEEEAVRAISGGERTVTRTDRYGRTVQVIVDGPMAGTIAGSNGILFEPPAEVAPVPPSTPPRAPQGVAGQDVTIDSSGRVTMTPTDIPASTGPTLARDVFVRTLGQFFPEKDMAAGWMDSLYDVVSGFYKTGVPVEQSLNLALREARTNPKLKPFADRFKGIAAIEDLKASGKPVIVPTIAEYVRSEVSVADLMTQAGLGDLATTEEIAGLLGKGQSVSTIGNKINQVFNRIDLAPQGIKDTLGRYFPTVDRTRLARTLLLGERGVRELTDELAGLEVLAAAEQQGIGALGASPVAGGVTQQRAQEYARAGITYSTAMPKFAQVRQATPTEAKLAGISGVKSIGQAGVEQAQLLGRAQELEQMDKLSEQEIARFRGRSGAMEPGLASQRRANRAF